MTRAALGNLTLLSTLINDDPTPQTPCRRLTIAAVKILIVLTWQVNRQHFNCFSFYTEKESGQSSADRAMRCLVLQHSNPEGIQRILQSYCAVQGSHTRFSLVQDHLSFTLKLFYSYI